MTLLPGVPGPINPCEICAGDGTLGQRRDTAMLTVVLVMNQWIQFFSFKKLCYFIVKPMHVHWWETRKYSQLGLSLWCRALSH